MNRLEELEAKVRELYESKNPNRADWTDWLAVNHVYVAADYATDLAKKLGENADLARTAALLHDIADAVTDRTNPQHQSESLRMARELMEASGYPKEEIDPMVDDALLYHSCHGDERPSTMEGKILATADALAHLKTDFYLYAAWKNAADWSLEQVKAWTLEKIDRDWKVKIFFDDVRADAKPDYDMIKELFSR